MDMGVNSEGFTQSEALTKVMFKVSGNCEQCEEQIFVRIGNRNFRPLVSLLSDPQGFLKTLRVFTSVASAFKIGSVAFYRCKRLTTNSSLQSKHSG